MFSHLSTLFSISLFCGSQDFPQNKFYNINYWGLFHKTLRICKLQIYKKGY